MSQRTIYLHTLALLERLCAISSPSGDVGGLDAATDLLGQALRQRGLDVEIRREADDHGVELPVLRARGPRAAAAARPLLVIGHVDTVLTAIEPRRIEEGRGDRLLATGSVDMKAGLAALVGALDLLAERGTSDAAAGLLLVVVPDEEVAGPLSRKVVEEHGPGARGLWVLEPGAPAEGETEKGNTETVVIGRRGMFQWHTDVHGRSAHAGNGYWQGRSAATAAARWWLEAEALAEPGTGPTVNAGRLVAGEADFVAQLARHADLLFGNRQVNVVPDRARVEGEARFLSTAKGERVAAAMESAAARIAAQTGTEIDFRHHTWIRPLEPNDASRAWARLAAGLADARGWTLRAEEDRRGISFSNFLPASRTAEEVPIPILDGLGPVGGGMHTRDEFVDLRSLDRRIVLLADLLEAVAA